MMPAQISKRIVADRLALIAEGLGVLRTLPLDTLDKFLSDRRNVATAESYIRRSLEALLDIGRHMLAKGFGIGVSEYKEIAAQLALCGVLANQDAALLRMLAGYRNRMVHFYHEITPTELYQICTTQLGDIERLDMAYRQWLTAHPEKIDDHI